MNNVVTPEEYIDSTCIVDFAGSFHPQDNLRLTDDDAYSSFISTSRALGWLTTYSDKYSPTRWAIQDVMVTDTVVIDDLYARFTVSLIPSDVIGIAVPILPMVLCADSVINSAGKSNFNELHVSLPVDGNRFGTGNSKPFRSWIPNSEASRDIAVEFFLHTPDELDSDIHEKSIEFFRLLVADRVISNLRSLRQTSHGHRDTTSQRYAVTFGATLRSWGTIQAASLANALAVIATRLVPTGWVDIKVTTS